jgi:tetratricopeptide (TPR) repeat protein
VPSTDPSNKARIPHVNETSRGSFLKENVVKLALAWKNIDALGLGFLALMVSVQLGPAGQVSPNDQQGEYDNLMQAGYNLLQEGEKKRSEGELARHAGNFDQALPLYLKAIELDEQALELFKSAEDYAPQDRRKHAVFFEGVALIEKGNAIVVYNRASKYLKRGAPRTFCNALHEIERSMALGMTPEVNPALWFELGLALMGTGDYEEGIRVLDLFDSPQGNPTQQEQSKIAKNLKDTAQKTIDAGKNIAPSILATCDTALIPIKAPTREDKEAPSAEQTESQIKWSLTTGGGYDGNVTQLGRGLPLPEGLPGKGAAFNETTLSLEGDWFVHHKDGESDLVDELTTNYAIIHDAYDDHSDSNTLSQTGIISYCHAINKKMCMGSQIGDTWLRDDKQNLSNTLAPQASLGYQEFDRLSGKIGYTLSWNKYFTPSTSLTRLDGFTNRIAIQQRFIAIQEYRNWSPGLAVTGQYGQEWTTTDGIVGDRQRENPAVIVEWVIFRAPNNCSFIRRATLTTSYEYRHDEYENATFPDLDAANRYKRQDDTHLAEFALSIKMWYDEKVRNRMEAILDYKWKTDNSNVPEKSFDDPRFVAALKFNF